MFGEWNSPTSPSVYSAPARSEIKGGFAGERCSLFECSPPPLFSSFLLFLPLCSKQKPRGSLDGVGLKPPGNRRNQTAALSPRADKRRRSEEECVAPIEILNKVSADWKFLASELCRLFAAQLLTVFFFFLQDFHALGFSYPAGCEALCGLHNAPGMPLNLDKSPFFLNNK